ncbi:MAG: SAM-dependent methyltransferase [Deltaproteobacteria bacterium]|nr:MAG: SAM-dependent methyltransferase [Deltaproteobacteria bacterium]
MSLAFLRAFARDPISVGGIWPSGETLARAMVEAADLRPGQVVVELGAGTGPITAAFQHHRGPRISLEPDPTLAARSRARCPGVEIVEARAETLHAVLSNRGHLTAARVLSGLPFAIWPEARQRAALDAVVSCLSEDGIFVTFTYAHSPLLPAGRRFRQTLERRFRRLERSRLVLKNVPPAIFYIARGPLGDRGMEHPIRCRTRP